jgi:F-type H+-transporting ATPase subunit gamma
MRAIRQTLQVTKAMNLISTAKLRRGRRILQDTEPFFARIQKSMYEIFSAAHIDHNKFLRETENVSRTAIIAVTSDKGLAGGYNANIFRHVNQLCNRVKNPILIIVGSIGYRYFIHSPWLILENFSFRSKLPEFDDAKEIAEYIISQYLWGVFDEVHIVYTHMYSSIKLLPREQQILPLNKTRMREEYEKGRKSRKEFQFEYWPSRDVVFDALVPLYVKGIIYGSLVEAYVSEQSARMSAMDEASKSAEMMLAELQINYNRARQAGITQEMTEIASGAETLSG